MKLIVRILLLLLIWHVAHAQPIAASSMRHVELGIPTDADPSDDIILDEKYFVLDYNPQRYEPNWASWNLRKSDLGRVARSGSFREDPSLPTELLRIRPQDYQGSGYDRGHLCPAGDRSSDIEANRSTFLMSNMVPQLPTLNRGPWERLEEQERAWAQAGFDLYIQAGPIFLDAQTTIRPGVVVPAAIFKIIVLLLPGQGLRGVSMDTHVISVLMPNKELLSSSWEDYVATVDAIENVTGYDFLTNVPKEIQAEIEAK